MAIRGQVDGMVGAYVVGWAAAEAGDCDIAIWDEAGEVIATGRASGHRPDLAALGLGRTTLAFRIPIELPPGLRELRVLADGEELPGSPLRVGAGQFDGDVTLAAGMVRGWVSARAETFDPPYITVIDQDGVEVGRGESAFEAAEGDPFFTPARFMLPLDDRCFSAGEMQLRILADGVVFATRGCALRLHGNLETLTAQNCAGWLVSPDAPGRGFEIEIFRDGVLAGRARSEFERLDVRGLYPDCGLPGFAATLEGLAPGEVESCTISLRFAGGRAELFDGPYVLASRAGAAAAAYQALRLGHLELPGLDAGARAVLQRALGGFLDEVRKAPGWVAARAAGAAGPEGGPRMVVVIPVYRGVEATRACIESVLAHRLAGGDRVVLIDDASPEPEMAGMLAAYAALPEVFVLSNARNLGFVQTVNRGLRFAAGRDVLLLNADTVVHAGGLDELVRVAYGQADIGTVTALSNNATIFSYPHAALRREGLADIGWAELAAAAAAENAGASAEAPTGHGFCLFVKGEVIRRVGLLDEGFGRGYGEENDFCMRAAAMGYRHVAAGGVLVEHRESLSFGPEKAAQLALNLPLLNARYPEYTPMVMAFESQDGLRRLRWALDRVRLRRAAAAGQHFVLVVSNALEGGTARAIRDIERHAGYGEAAKLSLRCTAEGRYELAAAAPLMLSGFAFDETEALFALLDAAAPRQVLVHQLLGFPGPFIARLERWAAGRQSVFYAHDFYALCPRVTMIDAVGRFCDVAEAGTCARCVQMDGAHDASRLTELTPAEHRDLFARLLGGFAQVVVPSDNAASYLGRAFPGTRITVVPHPERQDGVPARPRAGDDAEITLLGAIGPHKGSGTLLEIARRARLTHPHLHFRVIGYTDIDPMLKAIGNVSITGRFQPEALPLLLGQARGRLALFLPAWPETYSYTLSECIQHGFIPVLPDIGAPAERVRAAQYGVVFPAPAKAETVLSLLDDIAAGRVATHAEGATPSRFFPTPEILQRSAEIIALPG